MTAFAELPLVTGSSLRRRQSVLHLNEVLPVIRLIATQSIAGPKTVISEQVMEEHPLGGLSCFKDR